MRLSTALFALASLSPLFASAQHDFRLTGTIGYYGDFYKMNSGRDSSIPGRRPPVLLRLVCNPTFTYKDFSVPVIVNISPENTSVVSLNAEYKNVSQFVLNPINQIGIAPRYKWIQV